ncbi:helix-turn-helix transcriptional regulator [Streptomyces scabiei]|uniref:helix-turn-helix domain-containing protein n=1 Tax=Streptomyces scabiei TaxID=1930 RepID=UPI0033F525D2
MTPVPSRAFSGAKFKQLRKDHGVKGSTIARRTGIPESTLSTWAQGHNQPSLEKLILVADVLGCSLDDFLVPTSAEEVRDGSDA